MLFNTAVYMERQQCHLRLLCSSIIAVARSKHELDPPAHALTRHVHSCLGQFVLLVMHLQHLQCCSTGVYTRPLQRAITITPIHVSSVKLACASCSFCAEAIEFCQVMAEWPITSKGPAAQMIMDLRPDCPALLPHVRDMRSSLVICSLIMDQLDRVSPAFQCQLF